MIDSVQGALIGISGAIVGAVIAAITSYIVTKSQLDARSNETRRDRLIESRKDYLLPLRRTISDYIECSHRETNALVIFDKTMNEKEDLEKKADEFLGIMKRGKELLSQLQVIRGQLSDNTLDDLVTSVLQKQLAIDEARMPIIRFLTNSKGTKREMASALKLEESLRNAERKELLKVNKRIEELLSGEPSN